MLSVYIETGTESYLSSTSAFGGVPCSHHLGGASRLCGNKDGRRYIHGNRLSIKIKIKHLAASVNERKGKKTTDSHLNLP